MNDFTSFLDKVTEEQELFSSTDTVTKDKVISIRLEEALFNLLQAQNESWKQKTVSETVRAILAFHFLPLVYEFEWKNRTPEEFEKYRLEQEKTGFSFELSRYSNFIFQVAEYYRFLVEAISRGNASIEYLEAVKEKLETVLKDTKEKIEHTVLEQEQAIK